MNIYFYNEKNVKSKAVFVLEILKFYNVRILNFMTPSNALECYKKYILLNNL